MEHEFEKRFPANPRDYKLFEEVGEGVSATVYRALCIPLNERVAIKVLDLEKCNNDLDGIRREVQTMILIDHPNVLRAHCSFTAGHNLWVVMPYMEGGSALHIMKSAYPEGFEEPVIATLLREVLKALVYLHSHGHIHRDVKAGNILIGENGAVKLADFGVSACMFDTGDRQRSRNTFVGTPCWMAPEVMQQLHGYDFKADIWSFGITALELAHGHAPFSKYPPMKVLLMTLQNAPPGLDYERDKRFSKAFKEMVATCLAKDPKKRPTSEKLLKHPFFKQARSNEYLAQAILNDLPLLGDRFRALKGQEANFLLQNKALSGDKEQLSQQEYIRGISAWNFNLEDLKTQAALIESSDEIVHSEDIDNNHKLKDDDDGDDFSQQVLSSERANHYSITTSKEGGPEDIEDLEGPFSSAFPIHPLQALKGCFDVCEDNTSATSPDWKGHSTSESILRLQQSLQVEDVRTRKCNGENLERSSSIPTNINILGRQKFSSGSLLPEQVLSPYRNNSGYIDRDDLQRKYQPERNHSGPLLHRQMKDPQNVTSATSREESSEGKIVQRKGRFKVTSADVGPKVAPVANCVVNPVGGAPTKSTVSTASLFPTLQFLLQQNAMQKEQLIKLIKWVEQTSGSQTSISDVGPSDLPQLSLASSRERELHAYLAHLQQSIGKLGEEVQRLKLKNAQLEQQINERTRRGTGMTSSLKKTATTQDLL
ncbi:serine/threonine-protein kinase BLUS1 [Phoenix dactylifera]|uniref:Serine/threonine-protein kinase BLUS1 n=1 Tax=Phoenix dactylifera TaxID=42345 RepID=A0A8B7BP15_PHODC|nr:serine/threonine-protein kinase BLUS1 [Phoenix dactylifera]XP_026658387.1 serine/threonine-protein kinase BLUS1 [Phoenix dactylifera]